jgi:hypothetical protein
MDSFSSCGKELFGEEHIKRTDKARKAALFIHIPPPINPTILPDDRSRRNSELKNRRGNPLWLPKIIGRHVERSNV